MSKQHSEPSTLFLEEQLVIGNEEKSQTITISELVKKNQPLLSCSIPDKSLKPDSDDYPIRAGRNTYFSEDNKTIMASIIGYPRVDSMDVAEGKEPVLLVSVNPFVRISSDSMQATLILQPSLAKGLNARNETLPELLKEADITFGINEITLRKASQILEDGCDDFHDIPIATGQAAVSGKNEQLEFAFEIGPIAGKMLEDGSIDFRERKIMIGVNANELLAIRVPAVPGVAGMNVMGQEIEPDGGREIDFKISDDTSYDEESGEVRATKAGVLTVVNDSQIRVCSRQDIKGDVDYETGNVESKNCVTVRGCVQPGFEIEAAGDIEVYKEVMSGTLQSDSNIVVKGGITGQNTEITAKGDVDILFIEQGKIAAGGNVVIRKQTYYSDISAGGDIRYKYAGQLIGGNIIAGGQLMVANVGSDNSTPAMLAAGVDVERYSLYKELKKTLLQQQDDIIQWLQLHGGSAKSRKIRKMEALVDETKMKLLKLNMIPGTSKFSRVGALRDASDDVQVGGIETNALDIAKISIDIHGTIFFGTELRIGNRTMTLAKTISNRRIKLKKNLKTCFK